MGLRSKMFLQHTLTITMLLTAMYFIVNYTLSKSMIERDTQTLSQYSALHRIEAIKLVDDKKIKIEQLFTGIYAPFIASHLASNSNFQVQLFAPDETIVGSSDKENLLKRNDITTALTGKTTTMITEGTGTKYLIYSAPFVYEGKIVGGFRYLLDLNQHEQTLDQMRIWFIGVACGCLLVAMLASYSFSFILMKPLHALQRALKRVSIGDFSQKIVINSKDEVGELTKDFNHMSDALQHHIAMLHQEQGKQKAFYDNMTHELKTPLTSIIGFSDLIAKQNQVIDIRTSNQYIRRESTRLLNMVEDLLQSSLNENEAWSIKPEHVDLAVVTIDSLQILDPTIQKSSITTTVIGESCYVYLDPLRMQQVLFNVIDNAIKHSECTHILIELKETEQHGTISIKDNGIGISSEEQAALFLPSDQKYPRTISEHSHGLGLPLVKQLMELQGGNIIVVSTEGQGTEVKLIFNKFFTM